MSDAILRRLVEEARISAEWTDYRGRTHSVSADTLRAVLASLGLPAETEQHARHSLDALRAEHEQQTPPLLVGRVGSALAIPVALAKRCGDSVRVRYDQGSERRFVCHPAADGSAHLHGIDRPGYHSLLLDGHETALAIAPAADSTGHDGSHTWALAAQLYGLRRDGDQGIGDFAALATLVRVAAESGADAVAISPVHALFSADVNHYSPYSPSSRLWLNVLHVDPAALIGDGWLQARIDALGLRDEVKQLSDNRLLDWPRAARLKLLLLRDVWEQFKRLDADAEHRREFERFRNARGQALEDHARFETIHAMQLASDPSRWHWRSWPEGLRDPRSAQVQTLARDHSAEISFHCFLQWLAERGLAEAQAVARASGMKVGLITDLAVGTDSGGSHAWSRQHDMLIGASIGAPPDEINSHGQNWGLSTFSPRALRAHGYAPFIELLRASLRNAGGVRIDHILGLNRMWVVPDGARATEGAYVGYPLQDMLNLTALEVWRHGATAIGEDLGTVPVGFREQLGQAGLLGMRVLYFERDHGLFVAPSRWPSRSIATTTTHDLPTVTGWWRGRDLHWQAQLGLLPADTGLEQAIRQRQVDRETLWAAFTHEGVANGEPPTDDDPAVAVDAAIAFVARTPAPITVIPLEDILGLEEQPNLPGTTDQHPNWRRRLPQPAALLLADPACTRRLDLLRRARGRT
jgi:4-alpha-glucanotransferase